MVLLSTNVVKTISVDYPLIVLTNINLFGMVCTQYLDWFDTIHWSERPLRPDWYHLRSDDKEVAFVWSTVHKYAGCPDFIGEIGGVKIICDFKTSTGPYSSVSPERGDRMGYGGWRKYQKCAQQMAAYRLALEERVGYRCDAALIIVATRRNHSSNLY